MVLCMRSARARRDEHKKTIACVKIPKPQCFDLLACVFVFILLFSFISPTLIIFVYYSYDGEYTLFLIDFKRLMIVKKKIEIYAVSPIKPRVYYTVCK